MNHKYNCEDMRYHMDYDEKRRTCDTHVPVDVGIAPPTGWIFGQYLSHQSTLYHHQLVIFDGFTHIQSSIPSSLWVFLLTRTPLALSSVSINTSYHFSSIPSIHPLYNINHPSLSTPHSFFPVIPSSIPHLHPTPLHLHLSPL